MCYVLHGIRNGMLKKLSGNQHLPFGEGKAQLDSLKLVPSLP